MIFKEIEQRIKPKEKGNIFEACHKFCRTGFTRARAVKIQISGEILNKSSILLLVGNNEFKASNEFFEKCLKEMISN